MVLLLLLTGLLAAASGSGVAIEDRIDVVQVDRRLLAVGAEGAFLEIELERGEQVFDSRSQGLIGVVTTSARLLGVNPQSRSWRELRYRVKEREAPPPRIYLGDRVALVATVQRLAALGPESSNWNELDLGLRETLQQVVIDTNIAGVVTERRAIGFSARSGHYAIISLTPRETIEASSLSEGSLTLTTSRRFLIFTAGASVWQERTRRTRF